MQGALSGAEPVHRRGFYRRIDALPIERALGTPRAMHTLMRDAEAGPRIRIHVTLQWLLPAEFWVRFDVFSSFETVAAGMTGSCRETHVGDHARVGSLVLHGTGHSVWANPAA